MAVSNSPAYIVSALPDYVADRQQPLIKDVVFGAPTISRISLQTGIKTSERINILSGDPVFQSGEGCGFSPSNSLTFTYRTITTGLIKVNEEICPDNLLGKYAEYLVRIPEPQRASLPFEAYAIDILSKGIKAGIEKAIWQGDTTSNDSTLKWFDGFLKLALADNNVVDVAIAANTSAYNAIKAVIAAIPSEDIARGNNMVFVSPELFQSYMLELVEKNYYHYNPENGASSEVLFPGTGVKVVSTYGLTGTNYIFASHPDNLYYGTDVENGAEQFKVVYDEKEETFFIKVRWNSGVQFAFPDRVVLGTIATS